MLILKYRSFGVSTSFLLSYYNISSSSFYYNTRLFFDSRIRKRKSTFKGFSYTNDGKKVSDNYIKQLLVDLLSVNNPLNPEFFYKTLGSKKISAIFRQKFNIIINHKKIHRLRKELKLVRNYHYHPNHPRKRPKNHDITKPNLYWESNIKFIPTKYDGYIPILSIIDAFDRSSVGVYIGNSIKAKDFISTLRKAIEYRKANPETLIVRTDNGPQFKAKITSAFMKELNVIHEFGYKNNPNSQAYIESFHSSAQCEFVESIEFNYIDDVYNYYVSYIYFYNNLRPHGSLNYLTPEYVYNLFSSPNNESNEIQTIKLDEYIVSVKK